MKKTSISIVIPIFNEEGNVQQLHEEIKAVCETNKYTYEIILVDDGSTDKTVEIAETLKPVTLIKLRANFGQTAAMDAGIKHAQHDYIITMDGDRQNDPTDIPRLINHLEENDLDIVSGWRKKRKDSFMKKFVSRGANLLRKIIVNDRIHDSGCSLKIYRRECFDNLDLFGEMHRFIPALLIIKGFKVGEIEVNHRPRTAGKTKYNWSRTLKGFIDMISIWFWRKYAVRPLHLLGSFGLFTLFLSFISGGITIFLFIKGHSLSDTVFPLLTAFLFITGVQFFIFGLLTDMLSKNYHKGPRSAAYTIKNIIENKPATKKAKKPGKK